VSWSWVSPIVGVLLLGHVGLIVDLVRRRGDHPWRRHSQIDGLVLAPVVGIVVLVWPSRSGVLFGLDLLLFGLIATGSVVGALAWAGVVRLPKGPEYSDRVGMNYLADLAERFRPLSPVRWLWSGSRPLWWCLRRPRTYLRLRRLGVRGWRGVRLVGRWFSPAQVTRLGWPPRDLQMLVGGGFAMSEKGPAAGWDADAFIDTVHASDRPSTDYTTDVSWLFLSELGRDDNTEFLRYAKLRDPEVGIAMALTYSRFPSAIPSEVFPAMYRGLRRAGVDAGEMTLLLSRIGLERHRIDAYQNGWAGLAAWVEHDGPAFVGPEPVIVRRTWNADRVCERWRSWREVGDRAPHVQPALWHAAGFTVAEALQMIEAGEAVDAEVLAGLAALRRSH
jgi:hypothetical protein